MKQAAVSGLGLFLLFPSLLLLLGSGCGDGERSSCAIAKDNIDQCNAQMAERFGAFRGLPLTIGDDCSGWNACDAKCVQHASCEGMWLALSAGSGSDPERVTPNDSGVFMQCLMECSKLFDQP